eukprot:CAMPEP_0115321104 /NCGR_PEP_ID=MMETSP0270-20121206/80679_1 /TAXON_ID=71861 /ORGANISM="Scrippsiella trochoidea, Strain CCMP3099" /LENGTH=51 /DNA_ID=CAMNT_0002740957 /DNA_START=198 /DNA_END=349 /DNA_ORIENTATION=+
MQLCAKSSLAATRHVPDYANHASDCSCSRNLIACDHDYPDTSIMAILHALR